MHAAHPLVVCVLAAALLSMWVYWPLLWHLRSAMPADPDSALFVWSMEHAPHRLLRGQNPLYSSAIFSTSGGANLVFSATAPLLGLVMYPITALLGPVAGFNVLTLLTPVLNTMAARRMLRLISGVAGLPVTLGALVVGFSPLVMMHNGARVQLVFEAFSLLMLAELWTIGRQFMAGRGANRRRLMVAGALAGAQMWVGSEQLAIVAIIVVVAAVIAVLFAKFGGTQRWVMPTRHDLLAAAGAIALTVIVALPFLAAYFFGSERYTAGYHVPARPQFGLRIANLVTATDATLLHSHLPLAVDRLGMSVFRDEDTSYIGLIAVCALILVAYTWPRRTDVQRGALVLSGVCWVLALGPTIRWSGSGSGLPGVWRVLEHVPVVREIIANRLSMAMFIGLGVLVATVGQHREASEPLPQPARPDAALRVALWCLPLLLIPAPNRHTRSVSTVADRAIEQQCHGALAVTMPQRLEQESMAWQARSHFAFDMLRGFAFRSSSLPKGDRIKLDEIAERGLHSDSDATAALAQLATLGVTCVLSPASDEATVANLAPVLGPPLIAGDVVIWRQS